MRLTAGLRALGIAALGAVSVMTIAAPSVAAASPSTPASASTAAARAVRIAEQQRGKRYVYGAEGPSAFDCSGLVRYAYTKAGVSSRLGGGHSAYAMLAWARAHHVFSRSNPQVGDVVIYGNGAHAAIYIGSGRVISALNPSQGIRITALHALRNPVTGYIHTRLGQAVPKVAKHVTVASARVATSTRTARATVRTRYYVNLRAGASTASRVLAVVRPGTQLRVTSSTVRSAKRWDHVTYAGRTYWVRADMVRAA